MTRELDCNIIITMLSVVKVTMRFINTLILDLVVVLKISIKIMVKLLLLIKLPHFYNSDKTKSQLSTLEKALLS